MQGGLSILAIDASANTAQIFLLPMILCWSIAVLTGEIAYLHFNAIIFCCAFAAAIADSFIFFVM